MKEGIAFQKGIKAFAKMGKPVPQVWIERPIISDCFTWIYASFWELNTMRPTAFSGVCRIPVNSIYEYAKHKNITGEIQELLVMTILEMDIVFCEELSKQGEK